MLSVCLWLKNSLLVNNIEVAQYSLKQLIQIANNNKNNSKNSYQKNNKKVELNDIVNEDNSNNLISAPRNPDSGSSSLQLQLPLPLSVRTVEEVSWRGCFSYEWYVRTHAHTYIHTYTII